MSADSRILRIANAGGYWGDDPYALRRQVQGPLPVDVVSIDFLAEITMSILQKQKLKDPSAGYARDFVSQVEPLLGDILKRKIRIITNAGGVNPQACAEALAAVARKQGLKLRVAIVDGDDIAPTMSGLRSQGVAFKNMETGEDFAPYADKVMAANAYFGAMPVVEALNGNPDIVLCGRVTDTGITLAAMIHAFGWAADDWDRLAAGIVAGHIIECGAQATGGNFTDWKKVPGYLEMGYPIVECCADGSFTVTKHPGSGGLVSCQTVREQLLYEMGHPRSYLTPDVMADFSTIQLRADGPDRVHVSGVQGRPPTDLLKASIAYADGYKTSGTLIISGPDARAKAEVFAEIFWARCTSELERAGLPALTHTCTEYIGDDATHRTLTPAVLTKEILLRVSAHHADRRSLEVFRKLLPAQILSGPSGVAVTGGAPMISDVVSYWPALIPQDCALPLVRVLEENGAGQVALVAQAGPMAWPVTKGTPDVGPATSGAPALPIPAGAALVRVPLMRIAHARSGDKGDTANIGLIGRSPECYAWLRDHISAAQVKAWFTGTCLGHVERHEVANLWALNFLLEETLGGGGTMSLFIDAQGKTLSQALLRCVVEVPVALFATISTECAPCPGELIPEGAAQ
ncbi:MAG: acyclic terpene utilization AtuA family protein [Holophagaceae bacterium]